MTVGESGKSDKTGFPREAPPSGTDMDDYGAYKKGGRGVNMYRVSGSYLEALRIHNEKLTMFLHIPAQCTAWFQTGERYKGSNIEAESGPTVCGDTT